MPDYSRNTEVKKIDINLHLHGAYIVDINMLARNGKGGEEWIHHLLFKVSKYSSELKNYTFDVH